MTIRRDNPFLLATLGFAATAAALTATRVEALRHAGGAGPVRHGGSLVARDYVVVGRQG